MRRLPRWFRPEVEGLPLILVSSHALVALFELARPGLTPSLWLVPGAVYAGEFWRLLTFLFVPPALSPLFLLFWLYLFYVYADALETEWGAPRFTAFYLLGAALTAAAGLWPAPGLVPNVYLNASLFLAFAWLFPDFELLLFFVLPLKVKYLGYGTAAWMAWRFVAGDVLTRLAVAAALANFLLLLGPDLWERSKGWWELRRHRGRWKGKIGGA